MDKMWPVRIFLFLVFLPISYNLVNGAYKLFIETNFPESSRTIFALLSLLLIVILPIIGVIVSENILKRTQTASQK